ncbi:MAG: hypothetical protein EOO50_08175 [Flavobacterium sp.]|uniref:hypothetical protein n=1 Tax=Flavobacterium sp. TaxID=239 RepID=UPI0012290FC1|nr:hypothetical protein [Flavobacterium sp.]RZJ66853.1 MAG: hypothetical protein EOO50_08175 [Flavobacterium sp.]
MKTLLLLALAIPFQLFSQSDVDKVMRGGEILLGGLSILKAARSDDTKKSSKTTVESVCVKNRMLQKITFRLVGYDQDENLITKEVVVQKNGKECLFLLLKAIYTYEIILSTGEIYKKGEYKLEDEVVFTVKDP